ncbi:unnamed protein product, partial [Mesorhabditis belari]|uniref:Nose resistant-to-fluoxetine protein N-terminal domain-containing protein n=1 Tax=Mesorhabditis belari TaxID=2138241 RepID=A0AAF3J6N4_9BILA
MIKLLHQQGRSWEEFWHPPELLDVYGLGEELLVQKWLPKLSSDPMQSTEKCSQDLQMLNDSLTKIFDGSLLNKTAVLNDFDKTVTLPLIDSQGSLNGGLLTGHTSYYGRWGECRKINYKLSNGNVWRGEIFRFFIGSLNQTTNRCAKAILGIDICLPKSCTAFEIKRRIQATKIPLLSNPICDVANNDSARTNQVDTGTYIVAIFVFFVLGFGIISGFVDYFLYNDLKDFVTIDEENIYWKIFFAFSLYRNTKGIFSTKGLNK